MRVVLIAAVGIALAGCQSMGTMMSYEQKVHLVEMDDDTYRVFDHPTESKVMTTPSLGRAIGAGMAQGATLGLADTFTPEQRHERAARAHLDRTGRSNCPIVRGYLLAQPQYEFWYECPNSI